VGSKSTAEGIEALKEVAGDVTETINLLSGGIRSGMGYLGAKNLSELKSNARFVRVTPAGQRESSPHDVIEIKNSEFSRS
jgi:IMP dehydrogenase